MCQKMGSPDYLTNQNDHVLFPDCTGMFKDDDVRIHLTQIVKEQCRECKTSFINSLQTLNPLRVFGRVHAVVQLYIINTRSW